MDETCIRVKGRWAYLYRAVDSRGQTVDFLLSAKRHAEAAKRFFRKALGQPHTASPRTVTVDKNPAYPRGFSSYTRSEPEIGSGEAGVERGAIRPDVPLLISSNSKTL